MLESRALSTWTWLLTKSTGVLDLAGDQVQCTWPWQGTKFRVHGLVAEPWRRSKETWRAGLQTLGVRFCSPLVLVYIHRSGMQTLRAGLQTLGRGHADPLACVSNQVRRPVSIAQGRAYPTPGVCSPRSRPDARV